MQAKPALRLWAARPRLVPAWLSLWGIVGGLLLLTSAVVEMFAYGVDAPTALQLLR